jgi:hypothetical protein
MQRLIRPATFYTFSAAWFKRITPRIHCNLTQKIFVVATPGEEFVDALKYIVGITNNEIPNRIQGI